jgi:hypothetical protein
MQALMQLAIPSPLPTHRACPRTHTDRRRDRAYILSCTRRSPYPTRCPCSCSDRWLRASVFPTTTHPPPVWHSVAPSSSSVDLFLCPLAGSSASAFSFLFSHACSIKHPIHLTLDGLTAIVPPLRSSALSRSLNFPRLLLSVR